MIAGLLIFVLAAPFTFMAWRSAPEPTPPPLPFDEKQFVATVMPAYFTPNYTVPQKLFFAVLTPMEWMFGSGKSSWSFSPSGAITKCSVQGILIECMQVTSNRYLMPLSVAAGSVDFPHTNVLNGPQFVAAFEGALHTNGVEFWDKGKMRHEKIEILRFPKQKTLVVLPASEVAEFIRTNHIDMDKYKN